MKEFKGTKGDWEVVHEINVQSVGRRPICACGTYDSSEKDSQAINKANAQLIAAAPELLKALKNLNESMKAIQRHHPNVVILRDEARIQRAENTINKALGQ